MKKITLRLKLIVYLICTLISGHLHIVKASDNKPINLNEKIASEIKELIDHIGVRTTPTEEPINVAASIKKQEFDWEAPLGEVFPNAQKLVEMGSVAVVPLVEHLATLSFPPDDAHIATERALRGLITRKQRNELFLKLAKESTDEEKKTRYLKLAERYKS